MSEGYIKVFRKLLSSGVWQEEPLVLKVFLYLLMKANHKDRWIPFNVAEGRVLVRRGELITSYASIAAGVRYQKNRRLITPTIGRIRWIVGKLETAEMLDRVPGGLLHEPQTSHDRDNSRAYLHLSICNYGHYQAKEHEPQQAPQQELQQDNNSKQELKKKEKENLPRRVSTRQNISGGKNVSGERNDHLAEIEEIIGYLNQRIGSRFKPTTHQTQRSISARLDEGYSTEDAKRVIDTKAEQWVGTEQQKYLRPQTLFRPANFEAYLNEANSKKPPSITERLT